MTENIFKILLIEDDEDDYILTKYLLSEIKSSDFIIDWQPDYWKAIDTIRQNGYDIYLVDYRLGEKNGIDLIKEATGLGCKDPFILLTGQGDQRVDLEAMRMGAADYLVKGTIDSQTLERSIRYAIQHFKALKELNDKEQKYRTLFEKSIDAIFIASNDQLFYDVNSSMTDLFGYKKDEMLKMEVVDLFEEKSEFSKFQENLSKLGRTKNFEATLRKKSRNPVDCLINVTTLHDTNEKIYGYQGIIHNITERKKAEQDLLIAEKLSMTGKIARSIAHEVRNPLTNLNLALEQLKDDLPEDDTITLYTDIIKRNADRIGQLITEMLNSSKPKELNLSKHSINNVLEDALKLVSDRIRLREIRLEKNYNNKLGEIMLDWGLVKTAFLNVIINAIEAMEPGKGVLKVTTENKSDKLLVTIADNGSGISKENIRNLFDPFFTGKQGGMGLGLTSSQNIINSHGGSIEVESELGKGTIFNIYFEPTNI